MAGRIITMQRQARELGRLRSGYTDTTGTKPRPVKSETWIVTSHSEDYVRAAAELWGGNPEKWQPLGNGAAQWRVITTTSAIDAILPPGDPLSQTYELWSRGGCARRCDGVTELLTDTDCKCLADFGSDFHLMAKDKRCSPTSRLSVILPAMPDIGVWRVETHGFYAANEIAAAVDVIRAATGGTSIVPVQVRIEPRTRISEGKTKQFPVIVVALPHVTAGQILGASNTGHSPALASTSGAPALTTGKTSQAQAFADTALGVRSSDAIRQIWADAKAAGCMNKTDIVRALDRDMPLAELLTLLGARFAEHEGKSSRDPAETSALWMGCVAATPEGWTTSQLLDAFAKCTDGLVPADASVAQLTQFLADLTTQAPTDLDEEKIPF